MNIDKTKLTPMMLQYVNCKENYPDCILFYRLGDFYEMFFDDAEIASKILEITLTGKNCGLEERAPMCGVPYRAADMYIPKLIEAGHKVAICEQMMDPSKCKDIVPRDIVQIVTPGTILENGATENRANNYLMSIYMENNYSAISYVDVGTGDIFTTMLKSSSLKEEIAKVKPREIILYNTDYKSYIQEVVEFYNIYLNECTDKSYVDSAILTSYFEESYIQRLDFDDNGYMKNSLYILLNYIYETQKKITVNINVINIYDSTSYMMIDSFTRENLELTKRIKSIEKKGSLFYILDKTNTAMGARLLKRYIEEPLIQKEDIEDRYNYVEELMNNDELRDNLSEILKHVYDIERMCGKIAFETINPKELTGLKKSIEALGYFEHIIKISESPNLAKYISHFDDLSDIYHLINDSIKEDASATITDGGIIRPDYNADVAKYSDLINNSNQKLEEIAEREREKTGAKTLKIGYNKVFGYYIEISKGALDSANLDDSYERKQTLTSGERFITAELKQLEGDILSAQERTKLLEYDLFVEIRTKIANNIARIKKMARLLANIDVFISFAIIAKNNNYTRPSLNTDGIVNIKNGRHPVVEKMLKNDFIGNDTLLNKTDNMVHIITGPNMAGKSTYMRQVVLITLMAQIGSFVPADEANIAICDRLFARIGANDNLSQGQSTFMVEMNEVSYILNNATARSLVILDEVGRGTSTYDGISLARAIIEYIQKNVRCNTLFATHYFELTDIEQDYDNVKNYSVQVDEDGDDVIFLHKIIPGCASKSYGIYVAQFAKIPMQVICRAKEILADLEASHHDAIGIGDSRSTAPIGLDSSLEQDILDIDIMNSSPMEIMNKVFELQKKIKNK